MGYGDPRSCWSCCDSLGFNKGDPEDGDGPLFCDNDECESAYWDQRDVEEPPVCTVTVTTTEALPPLPEPKNLWDRFNNEAQRACLNPAMEIGATKLSEPDRLTCMQALAEDRAHRVARQMDIDHTLIFVTVTTNGMGFYGVKIEIDPMLGLAMKETP